MVINFLKEILIELVNFICTNVGAFDMESRSCIRLIKPPGTNYLLNKESVNCEGQLFVPKKKVGLKLKIYPQVATASIITYHNTRVTKRRCKRRM